MSILRPRKRFGQHFLCDRAIIDQMVSAIHPQQNDDIVEIGPGLGALTLAILPYVKAMSAVELDRDLIPSLQAIAASKGQLKLYNEDVLQFNFFAITKENKPLRIVGNLPYMISTPLIFYLISFCDKKIIHDMHFMVQEEVADRITAKPHSKKYGRLSVMVQYYCQTEKLFTVAKEAFRPAPQVTSAVIRLMPYRAVPYPAKNSLIFEALVKQAFSQRRKTLKNALKAMVSEDIFLRVAINPKLRPEQLSLKEFVAIANSIS